MKISFCTTCHKRLWQLKLTIETNLSFTKPGEIEICVLAYNDPEVEIYLREKYPEHIGDGRLKIKTHYDDYTPVDGSAFACGYVKNLAHEMGTGNILFNLDADNFIGDALECISDLGPRDIVKYHFFPEGSNGRIGVHRSMFVLVGGYRDVGRADDGDFVLRCLKKGAKLKSYPNPYPPIANSVSNMTDF